MQSNPMPSNEQIGLLDNLFSEYGSVIPQVIPTGVGFCLYIKRDVSEQLGGLNEHLIHRGYGEETEFCLRVAAAGWKNVVASNVYVGHKGSVSFGQEKSVLAKRNNAQIHARFPHHKTEYDTFLAQNFLMPLYRKIQREVLFIQLPPHHTQLHLVHSTSTDKQIENDNKPLLRLELHENTSPIVFKLVALGIAGFSHVDYTFPAQSNELLEDLNAFNLLGFVLHGIARWSPDFVDNLISRFSYQIHLNDESGYCVGRYFKACQESTINTAICTACVNEFGSLVPHYDNITQWKNHTEQWFYGAESVFTSTESMATRYQKQFSKNIFVSKS
jgi:hypothetical protein